MIQIVSCTNCGRQGKRAEEKTAWASIELRSDEYCDSCHHSHALKETVSFCTLQCLILFTQRNQQRLLQYEQDMLRKVNRYGSDYKNPLFDPSVSFETTTDRFPLSLEEIRLIEKGSPILAIKSVRERTKFGLKEAKDVVDKYRREHRL